MKQASPLGEVALQAALKGAGVITSYTDPVSPRYKTSLRDVVTDVDTKAEAAIFDYLQTQRPNDGRVGEESGEHAGTSKIRWIVDPLDGTANFVRGRPDYAVAVAAEEAGSIVASAIVRPALEQWIACDKNGITSSNLTPAVSATNQLAQSLISVAVSVDENRRPPTLALLTKLLPHMQDFRRTGSTSCDLFDVATGKLDAYVGIDTNLWDIAAGQGLVIAAGGRAMTLTVADGRSAFVIGSPKIVEQLKPLISRYAGARTITPQGVARAVTRSPTSNSRGSGPGKPFPTR